MPSNRPAADELEVCLFGPGVGECAVVHIGDGRWMVVDSCIDSATANPVAIDYLTSIGVDVATAVAFVVVTHWHDDHIRGAAKVVKAARAATFFCSQALRSDEFKTLIAQSAALNTRASSGVDELREIIETLAPRKPEFAIADRVIHRATNAEVCALSPSSVAVHRGLQEIGAQLPAVGKTKRAIVSVRPNDTCVALLARVGSAVVMLGSDLETGRPPSTGWHAVLTTATRPSNNTVLGFKVPHHGSETAYHPNVWSTFMAPDPTALITPFTRAGLPRAGDVERLKQHTQAIYCTARRPGKASFKDLTVQRTVRETARDIRPRDAKMGWIRLRISGSNPAVRSVSCFGAAYAA